MSLKDAQVIIGAFWRVFEARPALLCGDDHSGGVQTKLLKKKFVWMQNFDFVLVELDGWEVAQVHGDYGVATAVNSRRQNMATILIRQLKR